MVRVSCYASPPDRTAEAAILAVPTPIASNCVEPCNARLRGRWLERAAQTP